MSTLFSFELSFFTKPYRLLVFYDLFIWGALCTIYIHSETHSFLYLLLNILEDQFVSFSVSLKFNNELIFMYSQIPHVQLIHRCVLRFFLNCFAVMVMLVFLLFLILIHIFFNLEEKHYAATRTLCKSNWQLIWNNRDKLQILLTFSTDIQILMDSRGL